MIFWFILKTLGQLYVEAVRWVLNQLQKHFFFANLKKCWFYQDEICFLGYMVLLKRISIEVKRIEVIKNWPEPKSVRNIQAFLSFANFYRWFIQSFSKIAAPLTLMLKTTGSPNKPAPSRNNGSRSALNKNDNSKPASGKNNSNGEVDKFGVSRNNMKYAKKSRKVSKSRKSKSKKISKSQNLAKLKKKSSKIGNSTNFNAIKNKSKFLTPDARIAFNCL